MCSAGPSGTGKKPSKMCSAVPSGTGKKPSKMCSAGPSGTGKKSFENVFGRSIQDDFFVNGGPSGSNFPKRLSVRTHPNASTRIRTHLNACECIRRRRNRSEQVRKLQKTCENFKKLAKNFSAVPVYATVRAMRQNWHCHMASTLSSYKISLDLHDVL